MIYIRKGKEPRELSEYRNSHVGNFDGFQNPGKQHLRTALVKEQKYLCAYCMGVIHDNQKTKIEHYKKRTPSNELQYSNMLAVCDGNQLHSGHIRKKELTCDSFKGDKEISINPCDKEHMNTITYKFESGEISSTNSTFEKDLNSGLNLNCYKLKNNRKSALLAVKKKLSSVSTSDAKFQNEVSRLLKHFKNQPEKYSAYAGFIIAYLEKKGKQI